MAKPKTNLIINPHHNVGLIDIWCDNPTEVLREISQIEGVVNVAYFKHGGNISAYIDPRYDIDEIAQEIKDLLSSEIPDVFKD